MEGSKADFMINSFAQFKIGETTFHITTTHISMIIISIVLIIFAFVSRKCIRNADVMKELSTFQNIVEIIVEMLDKMVRGNMGKNADKFVNYISTIFVFILVCNISSLFGLRPPTADYGVTLPLGIITFIMIHYNGLKQKKGKHIKALFEPIPFLFPINLIGELSVPLSLSLRLFGNVLSGTVLMGLIYGLLPVFAKIGMPAFLHIYFDVFSGCIQSYVFCMLTMLYLSQTQEDAEV